MSIRKGKTVCSDEDDPFQRKIQTMNYKVGPDQNNGKSKNCSETFNGSELIFNASYVRILIGYVSLNVHCSKIFNYLISFFIKE